MTTEDKIKQLLVQAEKQGYLTYDEINAAFPEGTISHEEMDKLYVDLMFREVQIIKQAPEEDGSQA